MKGNRVTCLILGLTLFATLAGQRALAEDIFVNGANLADGNGSSANPFRTITQALVKARADRSRLSSEETIIIHVAHVDGGYHGTYDRPVPTGFESLPLILDVPNLELRGETVLTFDTQGLPTGFEKGTETMLVASPTLTGSSFTPNQHLLLVGPTSQILDGSNVSIDHFVLDGGLSPHGISFHWSTGLGADIGIDRVPGFAINENIFSGTFMGVFARASSGSMQRNLMRQIYVGALLTGGSDASPASYVLSQNRSRGNVAGGLILSSTIGHSALDPTLLPIASDALFDENTATVSGNDLSENNMFEGSFGLRCTQIGPSQVQGGKLTVTVTGNRIAHNSAGITIDAGFPFRANPGVLTATFRATFANNQVVNNVLTPALITFTRYDAALDQSLLNQWKYLQQSTYELTVSDSELNQFFFDNPAIDPLSGVNLNNTLTVNGVLLNGRNIP